MSTKIAGRRLGTPGLDVPRSLVVHNAAFWGTSYCPTKFIFSIT